MHFYVYYNFLTALDIYSKIFFSWLIVLKAKNQNLDSVHSIQQHSQNYRFIKLPLKYVKSNKWS